MTARRRFARNAFTVILRTSPPSESVMVETGPPCGTHRRTSSTSSVPRSGRRRSSDSEGAFRARTTRCDLRGTPPRVSSSTRWAQPFPRTGCGLETPGRSATTVYRTGCSRTSTGDDHPPRSMAAANGSSNSRYASVAGIRASSCNLISSSSRRRPSFKTGCDLGGGVVDLVLGGVSAGRT